MIQLKACPRCQGDMYQSSDHYGAYMLCAQCGHTQDVPVPDMALLKQTPAPVPALLKQAPAPVPALLKQAPAPIRALPKQAYVLSATGMKRWRSEASAATGTRP